MEDTTQQKDRAEDLPVTVDVKKKKNKKKKAAAGEFSAF